MTTLIFIFALVIGWLFLSTRPAIIFIDQAALVFNIACNIFSGRVDLPINFCDIMTRRVNQPAYAANFTGIVSSIAQSRGLF